MFLFCVTEECNIPFTAYRESIFRPKCGYEMIRNGLEIWVHLEHVILPQPVHLCVSKTRLTNRKANLVPSASTQLG